MHPRVTPDSTPTVNSSQGRAPYTDDMGDDEGQSPSSNQKSLVAEPAYDENLFESRYVDFPVHRARSRLVTRI